MAIILTRADMRRCLTMPEAIDAMRVAFRALSGGEAQAPQRSAITLAEDGVALLMPSLLQTMEGASFGLKIVTVMPHNPERDLPRIYATVLLLDAASGRTLAIFEGGWMTAMRTGAASGLATELLARRDADVLALFGAGAQAPMQVAAIHTVRPLREVRVINRSEVHYRQLLETLQAMLAASCPPVHRAASAREALRNATLVACATTATAPLFAWEDISPGTHINAIGAFTPRMCEVGAETLAHARIVVDRREAALAEAGDLIQALAAGRITGPETWSELGDLVRAAQSGQQARRSPEEVTFFKSVGNAVQDLAVALRVYQRARELGVGIEVEV